MGLLDDVSAGPWPRLDTEGWVEACATLQLWTQVVGKTRLALAPPLNHWWHVPLYVSARGLTTSAMPVGDEALELEFDFLDHVLAAHLSTGANAVILLRDQTVAEFYESYRHMLRSLLGREVHLWPYPVEVAHAIRFDQDCEHHHYDKAWGHAFWKALLRISTVMEQFRGEFIGKSSPVHFFWGSFDLALTRFSGRKAPPHPGGVPNCPDFVMREAYSHEVASVGFWPGNDQYPNAIFYGYAYPEPRGYRQAPVRPAAASFDGTLREFVLPYSQVRAAQDPRAELRAFLQSTYDAAAELGGWDRERLERRPYEQHHFTEESPPHA